MNATKQTILLWLERTLLVCGVVLASWCASVLLRAEFVRRMAVPPPIELPGDASDASAHAPRAGARPPRGAWIARLDAPTAKLSATVLEGSDDGTLAGGAGHIESTPLPGPTGNVGIAGHRDTIFRRVRNLRAGDPLIVTTRDGIFSYRVARTSIVRPTDVWVLDDAGRPTLTLVTCYPFNFFGHAPKRFIVSAELTSHERRAP